VTATAPYRPPVLDGRRRRVTVLVVGVVPFAGTVLAIVRLWNRLVTWQDVALLLGMIGLCGIGLSAGYHRMTSHRSFRAHPAVRATLLALGAMAVEGGPITWASTHLKHHALADRDGDPHSPVEGLFHAHLGWMLDGAEVEPQRYGRWLLEDRMAIFFERTAGLWVLVGLAVPFALGGWSGLLWGGLVRVFLTHHITWSVNSICHTFGDRPFETQDRSHNQWLVGVLAFGDGWHNNHHAFPASAFHGLRWWQVDLSGYVIRALERLGLVSDVVRVEPDRIERLRAPRRRPA
jgi:stearoyl-CoA desaturase (delta-9 desaturase)